MGRFCCRRALASRLLHTQLGRLSCSLPVRARRSQAGLPAHSAIPWCLPGHCQHTHQPATHGPPQRMLDASKVAVVTFTMLPMDEECEAGGGTAP